MRRVTHRGSPTILDTLNRPLSPPRPGWRLEHDAYLRDTARHGEPIRLIVYPAGEADGRWIKRSGPGHLDGLALRQRGDFHGMEVGPEAGMDALDGWVEGP